MIEDPRIVLTEVLPTAVIHVTVAREKIQQVMGPGRQELMDSLKAQGIAPAGPWFTHHLRMDPNLFDFEIGVPVASPVKPAGRVGPGQLRTARVARTVYWGPYEGLPEAWKQLEAWIDKRGHTSAADLWEVYVAGPESGADPARWQTELNRPLTDQESANTPR